MSKKNSFLNTKKTVELPSNLLNLRHKKNQEELKDAKTNFRQTKML